MNTGVLVVSNKLLLLIFKDFNNWKALDQTCVGARSDMISQLAWYLLSPQSVRVLWADTEDLDPRLVQPFHLADDQKSLYRIWVTSPRSPS